MSARTSIYALKSIDPIRHAVASGDEKLVATLSDMYGEHAVDDDFTDYAREMIMCSTVPEVERGEWSDVISFLIQHFNLSVGDSLPFNCDWMHYMSWPPYREVVGDAITPASVLSLQRLDGGRPLRGQSITHNGTFVAWLSLQEAAELYDSLLQLDDDVVENLDDLDEFHETLVESLQLISSQGLALWMST